MNKNKIIIGALVTMMLPCNMVYAASSKDEYDKEEIDNMTPGWSYSDINKSKYKVESDTSAFLTPLDEDDDDDDDDEKEVAFDQILESSGAEPVSISPSTGNKYDYWLMTSDGWMLIDKGMPATGWKNVRGSWYYLDENGIMKTGWVNVNGYWYYLYSSGVMASNTYIDGYYLGPDGAMR